MAKKKKKPKARRPRYVAVLDPTGTAHRSLFPFSRRNGINKILDKLNPQGARKIALMLKGGAGSGNFGHSGRPGEIGGSSSEGGGIQTGRTWIDKAPGLPDDTLTHHSNPDGSIKSERKILHDRIVSEFVDKVKSVPQGQTPVAIVMMGGTASGKSSLVSEINHNDFVKVDADAVKEKIPEYNQAIQANARNAAVLSHEESSFVAKQIRDTGIAQSKNLIIDGTGRNADKYKAMIQYLKDKGYEVTLIMPDIDVETAIQRSRSRAEKTGRHVPETFIREAYSVIPFNYEKVALLADHAFLYDNRGAKPRLVLERRKGKETIHDKDFVQRFRSGKA